MSTKKHRVRIVNQWATIEFFEEDILQSCRLGEKYKGLFKDKYVMDKEHAWVDMEAVEKTNISDQ